MNRPMGRRFTGPCAAAMFLCILGALAPDAAHGAVYFVAATGSDGNPGTEAQPFATIQKGIDSTSAGDTVEVAAGVYRERIHIDGSHSGTPDRPVVLRGAVGAVIDASEATLTAWEKDTSVFAASDEVYTAPMTTEVRCTFVDDRLVAFNKHGQTGMWDWRGVFKNGVTDQELWYGSGNGFDGIRALSAWGDGKVWLKIKPSGDSKPAIDPRTATVKVAAVGEAAISITGADCIAVSNFRIKYGHYAFKIDHSTGSTIAHCRMLPTNHGIRIGEGVKNLEVHHCEFSTEQFADIGNWDYGSDLWMCLKAGGYGDSWFIEARHSDGGHRIHHNYFHDGFDGVSTGWNGTPEEENRYEGNIEVCYNRLENMIDDALDPARNLANSKWHHNLVINAQNNMRVRMVYTGPFYVYNNIFLRGPLSNQVVMFYGGCYGQTPQVYIYNNTIEEGAVPGARKSIWTFNMPESPVTDFTNYHVYNNLIYGDSWCKHTGRHRCAVKWDGDYNLYAKSDAWDPTYNQDYVQKRLGIEPHSSWTTDGPGFTDLARRDVSLTANSPAREAGVDLYERFGVELPGGYTDANYYAGRRPDAGALAYGEPMPAYWTGDGEEAR